MTLACPVEECTAGDGRNELRVVVDVEFFCPLCVTPVVCTTCQLSVPHRVE